MPDKINPVSSTIMGTPVYTVEVPRDKLVGLGRLHNPPARGELSQYLLGLTGAPACFIIDCEAKFKRIFKLDRDGMLFPVTLDIISKKERERLATEGVVGWQQPRKNRGTK